MREREKERERDQFLIAPRGRSSIECTPFASVARPTTDRAEREREMCNKHVTKHVQYAPGKYMTYGYHMIKVIL